MRPPPLPALLCLLSVTLSPACAPSPALVRPAVPASLLACQPQPAPPDGPDDSALALWILDLAAAGEDCRARLHNLKELLDARP